MGDSKFLYFSVISANLALFTAGTAFAWSSPSLPRLNGKVDPANNPLKQPLTPLEESLIASLIAIGAITSTFFAGYAADKFGRKKSLIIATVPIYISYVIIAFARTAWQLLIARFLCGASIGALFVIFPNYVAEISEKHNRGSLSCLMIVSITLGNLATYSIGPYIAIKYAALIFLVPPTLFFIIFTSFIPESPYYLLAQQNEEEARNSLIKLRRKPGKHIENELLEIQTAIDELSKSKILDLFRTKPLLNRISLTFGLMFFQQFSGVNAILFYLQAIFEESESTLAPEIATIIIAVAQFASAMMTPLLIDRLGRRILLLTSAAGTLSSLIAIGTFFFIKANGGDYKGIAWLPVASLFVYIIAYSFGFGPVPFTVLGEIFPPDIKAAASVCTVALCFCFTFVTTVFFPSLLDILGVAESFWFFAFFCGLGFVFIYFCLPETKGKSLMEIQRMMG